MFTIDASRVVSASRCSRLDDPPCGALSVGAHEAYDMVGHGGLPALSGVPVA